MINFLKKCIFLLIITLSIFAVTYVSASNVDGTVSPSPKYAFGENLGWLNFGCDTCDVHVTDTTVTGHVWSRSYGWINLSPDGSGVTNNCEGELGGRAWSRTLGWVDFSGATINEAGEFTGMAGTPGSKAGRINFDCDSCDVSTDWRQCALRESPAQVLINSISDKTVPLVTADITITNEGTTNTEYQYEWCVVSDISNECGGGDDVYYSSGAKLINAGDNWTTTKNATVENTGTYYFKLIVFYGANYSTSTKLFNATKSSSGGGGGGGSITDIFKYNIADLNRDHKTDSIDFSVMLYFWGKDLSSSNNIYVDLNKDKKVDSIDFSILLYYWGK